MFGLKAVRSMLNDIRTMKNGIRELQEATASHSANLATLQERLDESTRSRLSQIASKLDIVTLQERIDEITRSRLSQIASKLDIAINEIEFVRRRTNAYLGDGRTLAYQTDQSPIFVDPSDVGPATNILNGGVYEADNLDALMSFIRPDTVFLDLGANIGIFSLQVGRRVMGAGKVYAFEPQTHEPVVAKLFGTPRITPLESRQCI